ncbi:MAG: hypothetical protein F6K42_37295, partial [Leptolyngbya sp. SIO1D8]|nr:hypothetical protein [Leptolyngbya sp. SIO1D8]
MLPDRTSFEHGVQLSISLGVGISTAFVAPTALATPAAVFEPILNEISEVAPANLPVRLPTTVPAAVELHPSIIQDPLIYDIFMLRLDTKPSCDASDCLGMGIAITDIPSNWAMLNEGLTEVDLGNEIQGYLSESEAFGSVQWVQDDSLYALSYRKDIFTSEGAIAMATSMV